MKLTLSLAIIVALSLIGCGGTTPTPSAGAGLISANDAVAKIAQGNITVIDVRTPEEFAEGHLAGARNINVEASDFAARISELDRTADYLVYCRSGRRSAVAATAMRGAGFTGVLDAGAFDDLKAAGAATQ